ncbi:MAG: 30S ribosomal protein S1 [Prevotellaceae bacterium]|jgi:small subunit ribosomal protein S1|nr:30S ribosomal protein S1 [Prevotellaceae bacterium]
MEEFNPQIEEIVQENPPVIPVVTNEFDWDAYEKGDVVSQETKAAITAQYDDTLSQIRDKEIVNGTIISINKREVVINIGFKSDGVIPMSEFRYNSDLKVGDTIEVFIENQEDKKGQLILSHKAARTARAWERVTQALETEEVVQGYIKCRTKGGMIVEIFGIEAFLPGSQIDVKPIRDYDLFVDKTMEFKVVKVNNEYKNVVVSHKALIEAELEQQRKEIISKLEKGQVLEGVVKNITSYGVFVDLGGVDGLIHITDLSWGRVSRPEEVVTLDQQMNVVILDFDNEKKRIALGLKQLTPHPWDALDANIKVGDKLKGKVVVMADYGAFVEVLPGVEGLVHVSEMSWSQHLRSAQDFLKVGDEVETVILTLDREDRKMSLGIKQLKVDPWQDITSKYAVGSRHFAKVRNFTSFGVFVEIEEGIDGLIHISDLSWTKKIKHPSEFTQIGSEIEVVVLDIDKDNRRLSLGHKQLEENPWDVFETIFTVNSIHEGTIVELLDKGAVVALPYGVEGFVTPKHLVKVDGTPAKAEEKLPFKVIEFNKDSRRIILSHSRIHEAEQKAASGESVVEKPHEKKKRNIKKDDQLVLEKTTLGDIEALSELKDQMVATAAQKLIAEEKRKKTAKIAKPAKVEASVEVVETTETVETPVKEEKPEKAAKAKKVAKVEEPVADETAEAANPIEEAQKPAKKTSARKKTDVSDNTTEA